MKKITTITVAVAISILLIIGMHIVIVNKQRNETIDKAIWWTRGIQFDVLHREGLLYKFFIQVFELQKLKYGILGEDIEMDAFMFNILWLQNRVANYYKQLDNTNLTTEERDDILFWIDHWTGKFDRYFETEIERLEASKWF